MMNLDEIQRLLEDRRLDLVSTATGLSVRTIADIRDGRQKNPKYGTLALLSGYLGREKDGV